MYKIGAQRNYCCFGCFLGGGFFGGGVGGFWGGLCFGFFLGSCMESKHSTIRFAAVRIVLTFYLIMRIYCRENIRDRVKRINKSLFQISINKSTLSIPEYNFASLISLSLQVFTEDNSLWSTIIFIRTWIWQLHLYM